MVDEVRVLRLLRSISDDLAVLRAEASAGPVRCADPLWLRGVKYAFVTAIEAGVDVAPTRVCVGGVGPPRDNGDAIRLLGVHGVLSLRSRDSVRRAVGFRNVLVHDYIEVDDGIVLEQLANLADIDDFVTAVAAWAVPSA